MANLLLLGRLGGLLPLGERHYIMPVLLLFDVVTEELYEMNIFLGHIFILISSLNKV